MPDIYTSWPEYHEKIEKLAAQIYHSRWEFNQIVCLARGGLRVGDLLSRIYDLPLAILAVSSYGGPGFTVRGKITLASNLTMTAERLGSRVLLVDDLVDSGVSLVEATKWLQSRYGDEIAELRTAVLWYKACSRVQPDYYVDYLPDNPWIHQPFERYEQLSPEQLAAVYEPVRLKS
ncbi:MAG: phosphoribosyltransferase family protein [Oscillatoriaceae cyanobacterium]